MKKMKKEEEEKGVNIDKPENMRRKLRCLQTRRRRRTKEERKKGPTSDSPTLRLPDSLTDINASIQKTNLNILQAVVEIEQRKASESSHRVGRGATAG